jgi:hypothetical protein
MVLSDAYGHFPLENRSSAGTKLPSWTEMKSPKMNAMLAAAGWKFKKMMQKLKEKLLQSFLYWCYLKNNAAKLAS